MKKILTIIIIFVVAVMALYVTNKQEDPLYGPSVVPNATDVTTGKPVYINPSGVMYFPH